MSTILSLHNTQHNNLEMSDLESAVNLESASESDSIYGTVSEQENRHREIPVTKRASALTMRYYGHKYPDIAAALDLGVNNVARFVRHVQIRDGITVGEPLSSLALPVLFENANLLPASRSERPKVLSETDKNDLISMIKSNRKTRRLQLSEIRTKANLQRVWKGTVLNAIHERGP
ncbi:hypothetical protein HOY82DRAFT_223340 [Tuber indicum]|nr:hypothetical protein HOY82DRAFT_223340 [Tuber indicum]